MYKTRYAILGADLGNPLRAGEMHVVELEVSRRTISLGPLRAALKK